LEQAKWTKDPASRGDYMFSRMFGCKKVPWHWEANKTQNVSIRDLHRERSQGTKI
jgi:hypothetical protein